MRKIDRIVIHCSDSPNGRATTVQDIDAWHRERGFKRLPNWRARQNPALSSIGYHFVVYTRGMVDTGRHVDEVGAHVEGYNASSIGICLIGRDQFSIEQWNALKVLVERLQAQYPQSKVVAHHDLNGAKTCPNFSVVEWVNAGRLPLAKRLYNPEPGAIA